MSDHIDGPRQIGDPSSDLTDLFAFVSPTNPSRTVLAADVFPSAGSDAMFSNVINHAIVVRRAHVAGLGDSARFTTDDQEIRFNFKFDTLEHQSNDAKPIQRGTCTLPDGQVLRLLVNDEKGVSTPDGTFRVFAGLRSDPFYLSWLVETLRKFPNLLEHDNVLCFLVEFDTRRVLDPDKGSLFGVIAETLPIPQKGGFVGHEPPRLDWVGRPEQTNMRLNNNAMAGTNDLRDMWNQQTPFAIAADMKPIFHERLMQSLDNWDMRDGKAQWTPAARAANANVFLDDFMLIDVNKPTSDASHLEIEKSTLDGRAYATGGGRTVDANVIDILLNWMVSRDQGEKLQGGTVRATKLGTNQFPYLASPNTEPQTVVESVEVTAAPDKVWSLIGGFGGTWHPLIAKVQLMGTGIGQVRIIETIDGKTITERLQFLDSSSHSYTYENIGGIPADNYVGILAVKPSGGGSSIEWRATYTPGGQPNILVKTIVSVLFKTGLESLKKRFG
jgi:hypothetical protein